MTVLTQIRLDKWLWAARFFKTRALATKAVDAGHVRVNDESAKPARQIKVGDSLQILNPSGQYTVLVKALNEARRPASEARHLYEETSESMEARLLAIEVRKLSPVFHDPVTKGRPTKKWRRQLHRFEKKQDF